MCGIVGMVSKTNVGDDIYNALLVLQHRGQDAAGIATYHNDKFRLRKSRGLVRDVFHARHMEQLLGTIGIGHVRYSTAGSSSVTYKGPGVFIAAGAGVAPFIAITRQLARKGKLDLNSLVLSNKTPADVICEKELRHYFGSRCILTCTRESAPGYENRRISAEFLKEKVRDFSQRFYICGPDSFVEEIKSILKKLGASSKSLVFEK